MSNVVMTCMRTTTNMKSTSSSWGIRGGKTWRIQTNIHGNGSTNVHKGERYDVPIQQGKSLSCGGGGSCGTGTCFVTEGIEESMEIILGWIGLDWIGETKSQ